MKYYRLLGAKEVEGKNLLELRCIGSLTSVLANPEDIDIVKYKGKDVFVFIEDIEHKNNIKETFYGIVGIILACLVFVWMLYCYFVKPEEGYYRETDNGNGVHYEWVNTRE